MVDKDYYIQVLEAAYRERCRDLQIIKNMYGVKRHVPHFEPMLERMLERAKEFETSLLNIDNDISPELSACTIDIFEDKAQINCPE